MTKNFTFRASHKETKEQVEFRLESIGVTQVQEHKGKLRMVVKKNGIFQVEKTGFVYLENWLQDYDMEIFVNGGWCSYE